ncbi:hypothetical protein IMZ48_05595 [Candidatus Bathyarchaeota archaeon]|nr:hypothetical protein [Candidatus Bathyarchaeota archaeon]
MSSTTLIPSWSPFVRMTRLRPASTNPHFQRMLVDLPTRETRRRRTAPLTVQVTLYTRRSV